MTAFDEGITQSALYAEEEILGAEFFIDGDIELPSHYQKRISSQTDLNAIAFVSDWSSLSIMTFSGEDAELFLNTMTTAAVKELKDGQMAKGLVLNPEGEILDLVIISKVQTHQYFMLSAAWNKDELQVWLKAHATLENDQGKAFKDLYIDDVTGSFTLLLVGGGKSDELLADYLAEGSALPNNFNFTSLLLDKISTMVFNVEEIFGQKAYLLLVSHQEASLLFRSFMSFTYVEVFGILDLYVCAQMQSKEIGKIYKAQYAHAKDKAYESFIRDKKDFIGANSLASKS
ncbi:MAG: hypothetical protein Q4E22_06890 [Coriobacteriia bacterium]|nr:hypothetical protein [Coriobacteriia bacterium]